MAARTVARTRQSQVRRFLGPQLVRGAWQVGKALYRRYSQSGRSSRNGRRGHVAVTTGQHDLSSVYRRKRMPRRKRRRWVGFIKKARAAKIKDLGSLSAIRNAAIRLVSSNGEQAVGAASIYGINGADGELSVGSDDINDVLLAWRGGETLPSNTKAIFKSAVLDLTMNNEGTTALEVDLYRFVYRKKSLKSNPVAVLFDGISGMQGLPGGIAVTLFTRGITPFQMTNALSYIKILGKKKYMMAPGTAATYQLRDPKNRALQTEIVTEYGTTDSYPGWTQGVLIFSKSVASSVGEAPPGDLTVGVTRTYNFCIDNYEGNQVGFVGN